MIIDYQKIADAKSFYESRGFTEVEVPWIIQYPAYVATRPNDRQEFYALGGYLNASGEQSFIELMLEGKKLTKNFCITPCFRQEPNIDELHARHFFKLELIDTDATQTNLKSMIDTAVEFFDLMLETPVRVIPMDNIGMTYDIVDGAHGIELGSYGIRSHQHLHWIYGTGIALPRLDMVILKDKK